MQKRRSPILLGAIALVTSILACNLFPTPGPGIVTDTPGPGPVTDTPGLPPPAVAVVKVAYIKGDNVWLWTEGVGSLQLTFAGGAASPVLSGDGLVVAFLRAGELWAVDSDGTDERQLVGAAYLAGLVTAPDTAEVNDVVWYTDSHTIYFNTLVVAGIAGYRIPVFDLHRIDADAGAGSLVSLAKADGGGKPYVAPDGSRLALAQSDQILFMAPDGSSFTPALTFDFISTYSEWAYVPELVWLADSSAVRLVVPAHQPLEDPTEVSTFWHVPHAAPPSILTTFLAAPVFMSFPYVSPDGGTVLYAAQTPAGLDLHTIRSDGTDTYFGSYLLSDLNLLGWTPDSVHFMISVVPAQARILAVGVDDPLGDSPSVLKIKWLDMIRYFYLNAGELRRADLGAPSSPIDSVVTEYDPGLIVY
jgi:hypothetical protein